MSEKQPQLDALFLAAMEIESSADRAEFLDSACGADLELRREVDRLLQSNAEAGDFLERPAPELEATIAPDTDMKNLAAVLQAGLSPACAEDRTVVIGKSGHGVLKSLSRSPDLPHVVLREAASAGDDPIVRPKSPEMPDRDSDSRYQLQGEIARGGMGAILKGRDTDLGRELAIKVLLEAHKDEPEVVQRFIEEAQIGGQLQHPGIAPIYELGQFADRRPFFSMKLVKGETLSKLLADRVEPSLDFGRFVGIFEQVCQTMAYAHSRGVIHRDLKPANIMVGAFGEVQVMDWGLAKVLPAGGIADEKRAHATQQGQSIIQTLRSKSGSDVPGTIGKVGSQTRMGSVMGTPAYMPPEQALGEIDNLDERADVFGLGAILCEILTGKPPYVADDGTQVYRLASRGKLRDCMQRLDACGADAELVAIAKHCLQLEPSERPRDAGVLAVRVAAHLASVETRLRESEVERAAEAARAEQALHTVAETEARVRAERRARRLQLTVAAVVLALVSVGGIAAFRAAMVESRLKNEALVAERRADDARQTAVDAAKREQVLAQEAQESHQREIELRQQAEVREQAVQAMLYAAEMNFAGQAAEELAGLRRVGQITEHWSPDRVARDLRGWEWSYLDALQHADRMTLAHPGATCVRFSPDGQRLASGGSDGLVRVWDAMAGKQLAEMHGHASHIHEVAWSPDGARVATAGWDKTVRIWNASTGLMCAPLLHHRDEVNSVCWSPDGTQVASKSSGEVVIWNADTGSPVTKVKVPERQSNVVWNSKTDQVAACHTVFDAKSGAKLWEHPGDEMQWSPDGNRLAVGHGRLARILSGQDGSQLVEFAEHGDRIEELQWSPIGDEVATASRDGAIRIWNARSGRLLALLRGHKDWVLDVAWSADGKRLASASNDAIKIWDWPARPNPALLAAEKPQRIEVIWSMDGSTIAAGHDRIEFWDVESLIRKPSVPFVGGLEPTFSPSITWSSATRLIAGARGAMIVVVDDETGELRFEVPRVERKLRSMALSPDGTRLAISAIQEADPDGSESGELRVLDTATGGELWTMKHHGASAGSLAWSRDGKWLACVGWATLTIVDAENGQLRARNVAEHATGWTHAVAWSPAGDRVAAAHFNHTVRVIDAQHGNETLVLVGHTGPVAGVSWSPDGSRIASCASDATVRVWNARSGLQMIVLRDHLAAIESVAWSPDGMALASGSIKGEIRIWDARIDDSRKALPRLPNPLAATAPHAEREIALSQADIDRELARLTDEIEAEPNSATRYNSRAVFLARIGRWRDSADDYLKVVKLLPARRFHWGIAATPMLMANDKDRFEKHCQALVEQFQGTTEADVADTVCKTCLLLPDAAILSNLPIQVLRDGADDPKWQSYRPWFIACCALISYREGRPSDAIDWTKRMPNFTSQPGTLALIVRAMAEEKLGQHEQAIQSLLGAESQIPSALRTLGMNDHTRPIVASSTTVGHDWLVAEILRREATQLIRRDH
jgi:WD40 repeat protein/serine/threonine protein kinase